MKRSRSNNSVVNEPLIEKPVTALSPVPVLFALANYIRWPILQMLADGREMMATQVANALGCDFDSIAKHLRIMRNAGVLGSRVPNEDRRLTLFYIPAKNRPAPGVLDYGFFTIRLPEKK
jgi:predicted transcriptional regulator